MSDVVFKKSLFFQEVELQSKFQLKVHQYSFELVALVVDLHSVLSDIDV